MLSVQPIFLTFLLAIICFPWSLRRRRKWNVNILPCPPTAHWLWGHEMEAFQRTAGSFYTQYISQLGTAYRIKAALFQSDIVVLSDPVGIAHVFNNIYDYPHSPVFRPLIERLLGRGLVWIEGKTEHRRMRRLVNPAFSVDNVKQMAPAISESAAKLQVCISNVLEDNNGEVELNILEYTNAATLDVIGKVGFDHDFNLGTTTHGKKIMETWKQQVSMGFETAGFIGLQLFRVFPFISSLPLAAMKAQEQPKLIMKKLALEELLNDHSKRGIQSSGWTGNSLLSILVRANADEMEPISTDELLDQIVTFVYGFVSIMYLKPSWKAHGSLLSFAGTETTAGSLAFALWELARHPEKQDKLRAELLRFQGNPTYEDFQTNLPYLDACCKEALRLHPPSAHMERVVEKDDVIPLHYPVRNIDGSQSHSITVQKTQVIYIPSISVNRLEAIWGDGHMFRPERWLEPSPQESKIKIEGWSNTFAFSSGPRNCVGQRLAVFEWKILMSMFIRNFAFRDTDADIIPRFSTTLQPQVVGRNGVQLPLKITAI
ncbi:hypothetical protein M422DRAFT_62521 [Sphaerobolus stellatus SS14]|nr:hypothetical protein M422DRAFT_62521 [Sphaerobolus stellatus SS14]